MKNRVKEYLVIALGALAVGGCAGSHPGGDGDNPGRRGDRAVDGAPSGNRGAEAAASAPEEPAEDEAPRPGRAIDLQPVDYAGLQQFLESHRGQPVVLDVWSTSCEPCVRELPNLAEMHEDYRDRGVVCATLNIDYTGAAGTTPDDAKAAAMPVLEALNVKAENLYATIPDRELFKKDLFQENGLYAPPAIFVFDPSGEVVGTFGEAAGIASVYEQVRAAVDSLLESQQPQE